MDNKNTRETSLSSLAVVVALSVPILILVREPLQD
jgi:hypothetical protein